ncbi:MAG: Lrp/AsnC family transcriptional regulator [Gammaproteobacteria bacterium]|jgi:DNA-binding Lrp family transcriptional regulator
MALDRTDCEILGILRKNARISNKDLARRAGLAPSTCLERVRRLRLSGVLTGFHAEVNPASVGVALQAMVAVKLDRHSRSSVEAFRRRMLAREEVLAVFHVAGANDFLVHLAARDSVHLRQLAMEAFTESPDVAHIETGLIFDYARSESLPIYLDQDPE